MDNVDLDPYAIEAREKALASLEKARTKTKLFPTPDISARSLTNSFRGSSYIDAAALTKLVETDYPSPVTSFYLTLTGKKVIRKEKIFLNIFNALKNQEIKTRQDYLGKLGHRSKQRLEKDLAEIESFLRRVFSQQETKGLAILKSGDKLNLVIHLPISIHGRDSLTIGPDPYILPLVRSLKEEQTLVVHAGKDQTTLYRYHLGRLEEIDQIESGMTHDDVKAGDRDSQQYHEEHLKLHLQSGASKIQTYLTASDFEFLVLLGGERVVKEQENYLTKKAAARLIETFPVGPHPEAQEINNLTCQAFKKEKLRQEEEALEFLGNARGQGRVATGVEEIVRAQNRFMIKSLFIEGGYRVEGYLCPRHHYLATQEDSCPYCEEKMLPVKNLADELVELAYSYNRDLYVFDRLDNALADYDHLAATLYEAAS